MTEDDNKKRPPQKKGPGFKRQRVASPNVLRILIPNRCAGGVIGKGGENIKSLREQCPSANIKVPECPNAEERIIHVECGTDDLKPITETLVPLIYNSFNKPGCVQIAEHEVSLMFADNTVGGVIGKGGQTINSLRKDSGASIKAFSSSLENCEERIVLVKGSAEAVIEAIRLIYERVELDIKHYKYYDPIDSLVYPRDPGAGGYVETTSNSGGYGGGMPPISHPTGGRGGRGGKFGRKPDGMFHGGGDPYNAPHYPPPPSHFGGYKAGAPEVHGGAGEDQQQGPGGLFSKFISKFPYSSYTGEDAETFVVKEVTLENNLTGCIIGDKGARIRDVRSTSGARVRIGDFDSAGNSERLITIEGTNIQCHLAEYMLQCCVQSFSTAYQNTAPPPPQRKKLVANPPPSADASFTSTTYNSFIQPWDNPYNQFS